MKKEKTKDNLTVTLDLDLIELLEDESRSEHRTMSSLINNLLWRYYEKNKRGDKNERS